MTLDVSWPFERRGRPIATGVTDAWRSQKSWAARFRSTRQTERGPSAKPNTKRSTAYRYAFRNPLDCFERVVVLFYSIEPTDIPFAPFIELVGVCSTRWAPRKAKMTHLDKKCARSGRGLLGAKAATLLRRVVWMRARRKAQNPSKASSPRRSGGPSNGMSVGDFIAASHKA